MLIHDKFYCEGSATFAKFYNITKQLSKRQRVEFALYCAKDVFHLIEDSYNESAKRCVKLVEKWLKDEKSVTRDELRKAANDHAENTTWSNADAACSVIWFAVKTTYSNSHAANAADAAYSNSDKLNEYVIVANSYLTKTNINCPNYEIEGKILYLIDELEENIIVHKDKYYVNMNGIENCPEYGFDTQEELLNELFNSKCLFWEFARNWLDRLYKENNNVDS